MLAFDCQELPGAESLTPPILSFIMEAYQRAPEPEAFKPFTSIFGPLQAHLMFACAQSFADDSAVSRAGPVVLFQRVKGAEGRVSVEVKQFRPSLRTLCPFGRPMPPCPMCNTPRHCRAGPPDKDGILAIQCLRCKSCIEEAAPPPSAVLLPLAGRLPMFCYPYPYVPTPLWQWIPRPQEKPLLISWPDPTVTPVVSHAAGSLRKSLIATP